MELRRVLAEKEDIRYQTKKHWAVFFKAAIYCALALVVLAKAEAVYSAAVLMLPPSILKNLSDEDFKSLPLAVQKVRGLETRKAVPQEEARKSPQTADDQRFLSSLAVSALHWTVRILLFSATIVLGLLGAARLLSFFSNKVIITPKRVVQQDVLSGSISSLSLGSIESVCAYTGLLGSLLGYGKVILVTSSGQKVKLANLRRPHEFERELFAAK